MTIIYAAATVPINPSGSSSELTLGKLWKGLEWKVREPQLFLAVIDTCKVLEDDGESVLRDVKFKDGGESGAAPAIGPTVQERITHFKPISNTAGSGVETFASTGNQSKVLNIVSTGLDGQLYLTYTFEWDHPEIEAGSKEESEKQKDYQSTAPKAVAGTISAIRKFVEEGKL